MDANYDFLCQFHVGELFMTTRMGISSLDPFYKGSANVLNSYQHVTLRRSKGWGGGVGMMATFPQPQRLYSIY